MKKRLTALLMALLTLLCLLPWGHWRRKELPVATEEPGQTESPAPTDTPAPANTPIPGETESPLRRIRLPLLNRVQRRNLRERKNLKSPRSRRIPVPWRRSMRILPVVPVSSAGRTLPTAIWPAMPLLLCSRRL